MRELGVSPVDGSWYVLSADGGMFRSANDGASWQRCGDVAALGVEVGSDGTVYAAGADVWASTDGCTTWTSLNSPRATLDIGIYGTEVWALADNGIYLRTGSTWTKRTTPIDGTNYFARMGGAPGTVRVVGTLEAGMIISSDGVTWMQKPAQSQHINDIGVSQGLLFVYAGSDGVTDGGLSCSDATGTAWASCFTTGGLAFAADSRDGTHVVVSPYDDLAETADSFGNLTYGRRKTSGLDEATIRRLMYTPGGTLIVASERGVFASETRPLAFTPRLAGLSAWTINSIQRAGDDIYLATDGGVMHASARQPFTLSTAGMLYATRSGPIGIGPDGTLIAPGRCIHVSTDKGATWTAPLPISVTDGYNANVATFVGTRAIVGTQSRVLVADPPYDTWIEYTVGAAATDVHALVAVGSDLYIGTAGGLYVSTDGGATSSLSPVAPWIADLVALADGRVAAATGAGVFTSDAARQSWTPAMNTADFHGIATDGTRLAAFTSDNELFVSADGTTWTQTTTPANVQLASVAFDTDGSIVLGTYGHGLIRVAY